MTFTCFDRVLPLELTSLANSLSPRMAVVEERDLEAFFRADRRWANGATLGVRFLDGSKARREAVLGAAARWSEHANVRFAASSASDAPIRVTFESVGSWSAVGTECLVADAFPLDGPTMSLSDVTGPDDLDLQRIVLHEFGHALGLLHEHQNPESTFTWDRPAVFRAMAGPPNHWDASRVEENFFRAYDDAITRTSAFDRDSIMLYAFPPEWTKERFVFPVNRTLSAEDQRFIREQYP